VRTQTLDGSAIVRYRGLRRRRGDGNTKSFGWGAPLDAGRARLADQWSLDWLARTAAISVETEKKTIMASPPCLSPTNPLATPSIGIGIGLGGDGIQTGMVVTHKHVTVPVRSST
jgi:hypothetical protein